MDEIKNTDDNSNKINTINDNISDNFKKINNNTSNISNNLEKINNITEKFVLKNTFFTRYIDKSKEIMNSMDAIRKNPINNIKYE